MVAFRFSWLSLLLMFAAGCQHGPDPKIERDKVTKVVGKVLIDGNPQPMVAVKLSRLNGPDPSAETSKGVGVVPSGFTDEEGNFSIGTYDAGADADGAPEGDYAVIVIWGERALRGRYQGDKFNGKYSNPAKSDFRVTVGDDPVDLGTIELTTN